MDKDLDCSGFLWLRDSSPAAFLILEQKRANTTYQSVIAACHTYVASGEEGAGQTVT